MDECTWKTGKAIVLNAKRLQLRAPSNLLRDLVDKVGGQIELLKLCKLTYLWGEIGYFVLLKSKFFKYFDVEKLFREPC